jgi:hypothetical protein
LIAGGRVPRYVRLRPRASLSALLEDKTPIPPAANVTIDILNLRQPMSYNLPELTA